MKTLETASKATNLVICVENAEHEFDLQPWQVYEVVPDKNLEADDIRIIDDTGEDYIYPAKYFVSAEDIDKSRSWF